MSWNQVIKLKKKYVIFNFNIELENSLETVIKNRIWPLTKFPIHFVIQDLGSLTEYKVTKC